MKHMVLLLLSSCLIIACNGFYSNTPGIPQNLSATSGENSEADRIILSWDIVDTAGVYNIYRSLTETPDEDFLFIGATASASFIDTDVIEEIPYYYRVSASDLWGGNESGKCAPVTGATHVFKWQDEVEIAAAMDEPRIRNGAAEVLYAGYFNTADNTIIFRSYDTDDDTWTDYPSPGTVPAGAQCWDFIRSGGTLYIVYPDGTDYGQVIIKKYNTDDEIWEAVGTAPALANPEDIKIVVNNDFIYIASVLSGGNLDVWRYNGVVWSDLLLSETVSQQRIGLQYSGNYPYVLYAKNSTAPPAIKYFDSGWSNLISVPSQNIDSNILLFEQNGNRLFAAYQNSADIIYLSQFEEGLWTNLVDSGITGDSSAEDSMAVTFDSRNNLFLLAKNAVGINAAMFNFEDNVWEDIPDPAPALGLSPLNLQAINNQREIYLYYQKGSGLYLSTYK